MAETFYSVLGVDPDADTATIKEAYREKVKTHHPDVSDESDAAEQFQRITEARDVLVDESDRSRYDRLGHDTYLRRHLDSTAWSTPDETNQRTRRGEQSTRSDSSRSDASTGSASKSSRSANTGSGTGRDGRSASRRRSNSGRTERDTGTRSESRRDRSTATGREDRSAWMGEDGWSTSSATGAAGGSNTQRQARANGWREQHAASNVYSPTGRDTGVAGGIGESRFSRLAKGIGPWIVFHFVFLISAFVTIYLLMSWSPTIPTMFGSLLLLGVAIFFSILHMVSRIYS